MTRRTKVLASVGTVALVAAVAGGGLASGAFARSRPRPHHSTDVPTLAASAPATTASFSFDVTVNGLARRGPVTLSGTGQADFTDDAVSVAVTVPPGLASLVGSSGSSVVNAELVGGTVYLEVPGLSTLLGAPWISIALPSGATSALPGVFSTVASALGDANDIATFARAHGARVVGLGSSTVDGTAVTGLGLTAHLGRALLTAKVWADTSTGQLVQGTLDVGGAGRRGLGLSATVNLSDYGAPVTVTAPDPSQTRAIPLSMVEGYLGSVLNKVHLGRILDLGLPPAAAA